MTTVYPILNETTFIGTVQVTTELVKLFDNLPAAQGWIADLAAEHAAEVGEDGNSVYIPPNIGMDTDEYYIIEMDMES